MVVEVVDQSVEGGGNSNILPCPGHVRFALVQKLWKVHSWDNSCWGRVELGTKLTIKYDGFGCGVYRSWYHDLVNGSGDLEDCTGFLKFGFKTGACSAGET